MQSSFFVIFASFPSQSRHLFHFQSPQLRVNFVQFQFQSQIESYWVPIVPFYILFRGGKLLCEYHPVSANIYKPFRGCHNLVLVRCGSEKMLQSHQKIWRAQFYPLSPFACVCRKFGKLLRENFATATEIFTKWHQCSKMLMRTFRQNFEMHQQDLGKSCLMSYFRNWKCIRDKFVVKMYFDCLQISWKLRIYWDFPLQLQRIMGSRGLFCAFELDWEKVLHMTAATTTKANKVSQGRWTLFKSALKIGNEDLLIPSSSGHLMHKYLDYFFTRHLLDYCLFSIKY